MAWTSGKAWFCGVALLVLAHALWWGVAAGVDHGEWLRMVIFAIPVLAAFLVAYLSPEHKIALGLSMSVVGAVLGFVAMAVYQSLGYHVDQIGSPVATVAILLGVHFGYAALGTAIGVFASRLRSRTVST